MDEEYISKIILELQPRSRRGYRRLFGIRENKFFNQQLFDIDQFTKKFLIQFNKKSLRKGEHIKCGKLIIGVKQIKRDKSTCLGNTQVEYRLKGLPLTKHSIDQQGKLNESFIDDILTKPLQGNIDIQIEEIYSCYCSECQKSLTNGDFFIKSGNWSRPILCLSCYDLLFTHQCVRCVKPITFDHNSLTSDGFGSIRFVENNGLYWHSDCCVCVTCLESLIGKKYYQDHIFNQLFCLQHIPLLFL